MAMYKYRAVDEHGDAVQGEMEASTAHQVTVRLQERGLTVNDVVPSERPQGLIQVSRQLSWEELNLFVEQLRAVVKTGMPLSPALKALASDFGHARLKSVLDGIQKDIECGTSLEDAIEHRREAFPPLIPHVIRAGGASGNLMGILDLLAGYSERMIRFRERLKVALAYPLLVLLAAIGVIYFLLIKIVPMFAEIFQDFGGELPPPTKFWIGVSDLLMRHGTSLLLGLAIAILGFCTIPAYLRRSERGRYWLDSLRYKTPTAGKAHYLASMSRFSRTLSLLLGSGVPILDSLRLAGAASGSALLQQRVDEAAVRVAGGETLSDAFGDTAFIGHDFCWLVAMGEERGELVQTLNSAADNFDRKLETHDQMFLGVLGPSLIIALALLIGSVVVSLYLPIFTLGDQVSGV